MVSIPGRRRPFFSLAPIHYHSAQSASLALWQTLVRPNFQIVVSRNGRSKSRTMAQHSTRAAPSQNVADDLNGPVFNAKRRYNEVVPLDPNPFLSLLDQSALLQ